ncbi:unnamed protein product [Leptosia nina]|uniref:Amine oxidase domain-containing protein n=1 Tax=Leptosia nina TaxID=320188 RepID=A0AAV1JZJ4_9NEOP
MLSWVNVLLLVSYGACAPQSYDVIVVGLGSSGVTAASILAKAGKKVLGLEAMDRIGGRVKTVPFGDGIIEEGAEWIHGTENSRVYDLATENNITGPDPSFKSEGDYLTAEILSYIKKNYPHLENDKVFIDQVLDLMNLFVNAYEASNDWHDVTTQSSAEGLGGHQHTSWHKHGYKTFFELMLNTYKNGPGLPNLDIKLSTEVSQIVWPKDGSGDVKVSCTDGSTYTAKHVIVTVSLGVLKERYTTMFSPVLPDEKITSIQKMSLGLVNKVILRFPQRFWVENTVYVLVEVDNDGEDLWFTKHGDISTPMALDTALTIWLAGDAAKTTENLSDEVVLDKSMKLLRRFLGQNYTIPEPTGMIRSKWYSNAYTRGSYTFDNLEAPKHPKLRENLGAPLIDAKGIPRVLFAGEATNPIHYATVHGASETGHREAMRIFKSKWYSNPYTRGSYTFDNLETPKYPKARETLGSPLLDANGVPRILFAGEATNPKEYGTVHGASETGHREAMRLLK